MTGGRSGTGPAICYNLDIEPLTSAIPQATLVMKVWEAIRLIEEDGWFLLRTKGSHRQYKHPMKPGRVTIAGNPGHDLAPGTLNSILKQAGLK